MEWKPIETAPRDGTEVLIAGGTLESTDSFHGEFPLQGVTIASWRWNGWDAGCSGGHGEYFMAKPTHWMPLPPPPSDETPR